MMRKVVPAVPIVTTSGERVHLTLTFEIADGAVIGVHAVEPRLRTPGTRAALGMIRDANGALRRGRGLAAWRHELDALAALAEQLEDLEARHGRTA